MENNPVVEFLRENKNIAYSKKRLVIRLNMRPKLVKYFINKGLNTNTEYVEVVTHKNENKIIDSKNKDKASEEWTEMIKLEKPIIKRVLPLEVGSGKDKINVFKWN